MAIRINYPNDRAVGRCFVAFERERSLFAAAPEDEFTNTAADGVERDCWIPFWLKVGIERLHDQEFSTVQRFILHRRDNITDDACNLHLLEN